LLQFSNPKKRELASDTEKENESQDRMANQAETIPSSASPSKTQSSFFSSMKVKQPEKDVNDQAEEESPTPENLTETMEVV
jgi:hypothetical protein